MTKPLPNLPNPFLGSQVGSRPPFPGRFAARPALVVFLLCLVLGLVAVAWRAKARRDDARARARVEAAARGAALELQFGQALSAAEVLGVLARQCGGAIPNFQTVAAELLAARPGVSSLELQPKGVVSEIVPRAGQERAIGFNVLNHPVYRPGAEAAIQRRVLTVAGPLPLYRGEPGIVARVPVFQRGRDGRDYFWGFVAASMRLSEALRRAGVDDLARQGYCYAFFAPASGKQKAVTIAASGTLAVQSAVQHPVRLQDLEFRLALQRRGGWVNKTRVALELLGVLAASGLFCLLVNSLGSRRAVETALAEANQRLARETADGKQAREDCRTAKDEAAAARAELDRARLAVHSSSESEARLNASVRAADEAAQAKQAELEQARAALQQAEQTISNLQARLTAAARAEKEAVPTPITSPEPGLPVTRMPEVAPANDTPSPSQPPADRKRLRERRKKTRRDGQMDFFETQTATAQTPVGLAADVAAEEPAVEAPSLRTAEPPTPSAISAAAEPATPASSPPEPIPLVPKTVPKPKQEKPARPLRAPPPVDPAQLRKAVNLIVPLFTGQDPGARDCLKANRATFRSAFAPETFIEFEQSVKDADFTTALEHLKKAARRHGIPA